MLSDNPLAERQITPLHVGYVTQGALIYREHSQTVAEPVTPRDLPDICNTKSIQSLVLALVEARCFEKMHSNNSQYLFAAQFEVSN